MDNERRRETVSELIRVARVLGRAGYLPATDGNFSARAGRQHVLLTAGGVEKRDLKSSDVIEVRLDGPRPPRASSEWPMHRQLYLHREDVNCVLHVHSPALTAFAAAHRLPRAELLAETWSTVGRIALVAYCRPGTDRVGQALLETDSTASVYLLANHGAVAVGGSVTEALHRIERAEFLARVELHAVLLGGGRVLDLAQLGELSQALP